ncbi:unnamed protein product, partial [Didymodactylos carnosus]
SGKQCISCSLISTSTFQQLIKLLNCNLLNLNGRQKLLFLLKSIGNDICTYFVDLHKNPRDITPQKLWKVLDECCRIPSPCSSEIVNELLESIKTPNVLDVIYKTRRSIFNIWFHDWEEDRDPREDIVVKMSFNSWSYISDYMKMSVKTRTTSIEDLTALFDAISDPYEFEDLLYAFTLLSSIDPINSSSYQTLSESLKALKCILTKFLQFTHLKHGFTPKATWIRFKSKKPSYGSFYQSYVNPIYSFYYNQNKSLPPPLCLKQVSYQCATIDNDIDVDDLLSGHLDSRKRRSYLWYSSNWELKEELLKIKEMNIEQLSLYIKTIHDNKPSNWYELRPACEKVIEKRIISVQQILTLTTVDEERKTMLLKQLKEIWDLLVSGSLKPFSIFEHQKQNVRYPIEKKKQKLPRNKNLVLMHRKY